MKRRHFLLGGSALVSTGWAGANDRVQVAIIGVGGRGNDLMNEVTKLPTAQVAALVDPDGRRTEAAAQKLVAKGAPRPRLESDMRRIFESKDVDAVAIATCNHWHALSAIWAMQAGKDVYVEKPVSHNIFEGRMLVEFARKRGRVVQGGTQRRSYARFRKIAELIHGGAIGDVYLAKWVFPGRRDSIGFKKPQPVPAWLNFDLWLGPAPQQDYHENLVHYNWHWFWDFGNGELGNNGIHLVDVARWCMNKGLPSKVHSWGGRWGYYDQAQTPNTQNVTWTYADGTSIVGELRGLYTIESFFWDFFGTKGHMHVDSDGKFQITLGRNKTPEPAVEPAEEINHMKNFTDAVKSRDWKSLNAEIEQTHLSTALCHLGNISYRLERELIFDPVRERFVGDDVANSLIGREYRAPYVVPDRA
ncbi:MAG: Gfo/Idh/MocA family oxidoreductase [Bryobacteraceae bacterium]